MAPWFRPFPFPPLPGDPSAPCPDCGRWLKDRAAVRRHRGQPGCTLVLTHRRLHHQGFVHNARFGPPGIWLTEWNAYMDLAWPGEHRRLEPVGRQIHPYDGSKVVVAWWLRPPEPDADLTPVAASARRVTGELRHLDEGTWDLTVGAVDVDGDDHVDVEVTGAGGVVGRFRLGRRRVWFLDDGRPVPDGGEAKLAPTARRFLHECRDAPGFLWLEPLHAFRWLEEGFPPMEAVRWTRCATSIPSEAAEWRGIDVSPVAARFWFGHDVIEPEAVTANQYATDRARHQWREALDVAIKEEREFQERLERDRREYFDPATRHKFDDWGFRREP
jgi:hypothetical protein